MATVPLGFGSVQQILSLRKCVARNVPLTLPTGYATSRQCFCAGKGKRHDKSGNVFCTGLYTRVILLCSLRFYQYSLVLYFHSLYIWNRQTSQQFRHWTEARTLCPVLLYSRYFEQNVKGLIQFADNPYNKSQPDALFLNFILVKNSTCFGQTYCPSSGALILYSQQQVFVILVMLTVC